MRNSTGFSVGVKPWFIFESNLHKLKSPWNPVCGQSIACQKKHRDIAKSNLLNRMERAPTHNPLQSLWPSSHSCQLLCNLWPASVLHFQTPNTHFTDTQVPGSLKSYFLSIQFSKPPPKAQNIGMGLAEMSLSRRPGEEELGVKTNVPLALRL